MVWCPREKKHQLIEMKRMEQNREIQQLKTIIVELLLQLGIILVLMLVESQVIQNWVFHSLLWLYFGIHWILFFKYKQRIIK